jgi:hypothetical protein
VATGPDEEKLVSLSGAPIWVHDEPTPFQAPEGEMCLAEISAHIEQHLGPVETVFHELVSDTVHIDVHIVLPTPENDCVRLVTSGMSDLPMTVPEHSSAPRHAELMMTLPAGWRLDQASLESAEWYWPIRLLKILARLPHKYATWLGVGHTMPNGDPVEPFAPNTRLCGAMIVPPLTSPDAFDSLTIDEEKVISFYSVLPIYQAEMDLKLRKGADALFDRLSAKRISDLVDLDRPDVAKKRFGFF